MTYNYGNLTNLGDEGVRIALVNADNRLGLPKWLGFTEERFALVRDQLTGENVEKVIGPTGRRLRLDYNAETLGASMKIRNPLTDEDTGTTMTMQEAYVVLYSLGRHAQELKDAEEATSAAEEGTD